jgi:cyclopropane fatty-acyl-phospholipid synthase-like methyltransferase
VDFIQRYIFPGGSCCQAILKEQAAKAGLPSGRNLGQSYATSCGCA